MCGDLSIFCSAILYVVCTCMYGITLTCMQLKMVVTTVVVYLSFGNALVPWRCFACPVLLRPIFHYGGCIPKMWWLMYKESPTHIAANACLYATMRPNRYKWYSYRFSSNSSLLEFPKAVYKQPNLHLVSVRSWLLQTVQTKYSLNELRPTLEILDILFT